MPSPHSSKDFYKDKVRKIPEGVDPIIRKLYVLAKAQEITYGEWEQASGVSIDCFRDGWRRYRNPSLLKFIAAAEALGYRLTFERIPQPSLGPEDIVPADPSGPTEDNFYIGEASVSDLLGEA